MSQNASDDSEILRQAYGEQSPMNSKGGSVWVGIVVGLSVSIGGVLVSHYLDGSKDRETVLSNTATSVAELKTSVSYLSEQVKQFTEQPYVRRDEFQNRISGFEQRISNVERDQQSHRSR